MAVRNQWNEWKGARSLHAKMFSGGGEVEEGLAQLLHYHERILFRIHVTSCILAANDHKDAHNVGVAAGVQHVSFNSKAAMPACLDNNLGQSNCLTALLPPSAMCCPVVSNGPCSPAP